MHNTSFWTKFLRTLQFELSEGLVFRGQRRNEEVCYKLLAPLLGRVAHSTSQLPVPQDSGLEGIVLYLISQLRSAYRRSRKSTGGGRPQVDFTMSAHVDSDTFYCKAEVGGKRHSEYQATLSCRGIMRKYISVGMLVDEITFSPWCYHDGVPIPIAPVTQWRQGPLISRAVCMALCLVPTLITPRLPVDSALSEVVFTNSEYIRKRGYIGMHGLIAFQSTVKDGESSSLWCSVSRGASSRIW